MAKMEFRLGEWFKQVEIKEKELKAKKQPAANSADCVDSITTTETTSEPRPMQQVAQSLVADIENAQYENEQQQETNRGTTATLVAEPNENTGFVDDSDIPQVEDFISFKSKEKSEPAPKRYHDDEVTPVKLSEGTGEPRPLKQNKLETVIDAPVIENVEAAVATPATQTITVLETAGIIEHAEDKSHIQENWDRMPHHLQVLFASSDGEVAQNSYKAFRESRGELVARLLDPSLTLEETSRILNVCPTTVRRYTNRGVLPHYRTAGNQRRFKLSDILSFMESISSEPGDSARTS